VNGGSRQLSTCSGSAQEPVLLALGYHVGKIHVTDVPLSIFVNPRFGVRGAPGSDLEDGC